MKIILLLFLFSASFIYGWGEEGHKLINKKAVENLPKEMSEFSKWKNFLVEHSADADKRRKDDPDEFPRHFIDIDFYNEFNTGIMNFEKEYFIKKYGDSVVTQMGILPWTLFSVLENLTHAFKEKNRDRILILAADLGHYVADAHQPMHTVLNYDGQLTNQKGLHSRYESKMFNKYLNEIENSVNLKEANYVENPTEYIFNFISNSNSLNPLILEADLHAQKYGGEVNSDEYYNNLWFRLQYITGIQVIAAINALSSLLYTAWVNAGKPNLNEIN